MQINSYLAKVIDYIYSDDYKEQYDKYKFLNISIEDRLYTINLDSNYINDTGILNISFYFDEEDKVNMMLDKCLNFFIILNIDERALYKKDIKVQYNLFVNCNYYVVYNLVSVSEATKILNYKYLSTLDCFCTFDVNLDNKSIYLYGISNFLFTLEELYKILNNQSKNNNIYLGTECEKGNYSIEFNNCNIYFNNILEEEYLNDFFKPKYYSKLLTLSESNNIFIKHSILNINNIIEKPYFYNLVKKMYHYCNAIILVYDLSFLRSIEKEIVSINFLLESLKCFDKITFRLILSEDNFLRAVDYFGYSYESFGCNCIQWTLKGSNYNI